MKTTTIRRRIFKGGVSIQGQWYTSPEIIGFIGSVMKISLPGDDDCNELIGTVGDAQMKLTPARFSTKHVSQPEP